MQLQPLRRIAWFHVCSINLLNLILSFKKNPFKEVGLLILARSCRDSTIYYH